MSGRGEWVGSSRVHRYLTGMGRIGSLEPFAPLGPLYESPK